MRSFAETFSDFLGELKNNIAIAMSEDSPTYEKLKAENEQRLMQIKSVAPIPLLDNYIDTLYEIAAFETNYCYLCGMRDSKRNKIDPKDESVSQELYKYEKYAKCKALASEQYIQLQSLLTPECCEILTRYNETKDTIIGLEKYYCYSGGVSDKINLDDHLNPDNTDEWETLTDIFL